MRFLSHLIMALSAINLVSAQCTGFHAGTPSSKAIRVFITQTSVTGDFSSNSYSGGHTGLVGGDAICNTDAIHGDNAGTTVPELVSLGTQNLFKAVLSNQLTDAASRWGLSFDKLSGGTPVYAGPADATWDVVDAHGTCLASNLAEFFGCGVDYNTAFTDSTGTYVSTLATVKLWTGSLCNGGRWMVFTGTDSSDGSGGFTTSSQVTAQQSYCSYAGVGGVNVNSTNQGFDYAGNAASVNTEIGIVGQTAEISTDWIQQGTFACTSGQQLICMQAAQPPQVTGDPQFTGLQGQHFQVHGMPDEFFNLITTPDMQLNSRFTYLASGTCNYNNTECWTHPGTYVDQLGFMFPGLRIKAIAGSHQKGMMVSINDVRMDVSHDVATYTITNDQHNNDTVVITHSTYDTLIVRTPIFTITATNSDMFFNFGVEFHDRALLSAGSAVHHITAGVPSPYPSYPMHGLLGQTWQNARYKHGHMYQGQVDDYMCSDSQLFSTKFVYNKYQH